MDKKFKDWYQSKRPQDGAEFGDIPPFYPVAFVYEAYLLGKSTKSKKKGHPARVGMIDAWSKQYPDHGFNGVDGKKIDSLIVKITKSLEARGKLEPTPENIIFAWQYLLQYLKRTNNYYHGKALRIIEADYGTILLEMSGNGKIAGKKESTFDAIRNL